MQTTLEPLYINAIVNNEVTKITIDTGANVSCIRHNLINYNNTDIFQPKIKLYGPNNEPLECLGCTYIYIDLGKKFEVYAYIIKDLSSKIILGADFQKNMGQS